MLDGLVAFRQFDHKGDDRLAQGGVLDAGKGSMEPQSLYREGRAGRSLTESRLFFFRSEEVDRRHAQDLGKAQQVISANPLGALFVNA